MYELLLSTCNPKQHFSFAGVFRESTSHALEFYSTEYPAFHQTAHYISFIASLWNILSIKTSFKCKILDTIHRFCRQTYFGSFKTLCQNHEPMKFLQEFFQNRWVSPISAANITPKQFPVILAILTMLWEFLYLFNGLCLLLQCFRLHYHCFTPIGRMHTMLTD